MSKDKILSLAQKVNPKVNKEDISELSGGYSSSAYNVNAPDKPFVLLVEKEGAVTKSNYGHAYVTLELLQKHQFKHSPVPIWLSDDRSAIAISYFNGTASDKVNFVTYNIDTKQLSLDVIDSLLDTSVITIDEYNRMATKYDVKPAHVETTQGAARKYGTEWFEIVKKSCPDQTIVRWLEPRIATMHKLADELANNEPTFGLGDPSNPNILVNKDGQFMLIDWDSATFHTSGAVFYVAYTTELTDFMKPYRENLIEHVSKRLNISKEGFANKVTEYRRFNGIGDINWAAMMMAKVNSGELSDDINHFKNIALSRIDNYEKTFEK